MKEILKKFNWEKTPLIPAIAQDVNGRVLMLAYMSQKSLKMSLKSGVVHYFSRSKNRIWKKGEESGNIQKIKEIYIDCDNDALLFVVEQAGFACHSGEYSCFFTKININNAALESNATNKAKSPYHTLDLLYHILQNRKSSEIDSSYTASLYHKGENTIGKKIAEEAAELAFAIKDKNENEIIYECADLFYHALVGLSYRDISPTRVMDELKRRFKISGIAEKAARKDKLNAIKSSDKSKSRAKNELLAKAKRK